MFYPPKLPQAQQLRFASRQVTAIEVNGTCCVSQEPNTFSKRAAETPDRFVFSLKAPRFAVNRKPFPEEASGLPLRHVLDLRYASFDAAAGCGKFMKRYDRFGKASASASLRTSTAAIFGRGHHRQEVI